MLPDSEHRVLPRPIGPPFCRFRSAPPMRRNRISPVFVRVLALAVCARALAGEAAKRPRSIDELMALKSVGAPAISPSGAHVVFAVSAWEHPSAKSDTVRGDKHDMRSHLWLVPADGSRPPRQITFSERGESAPAWSRDGSVISFVSGRGTAPAGADAPRSQLFILPLDGGEAEKRSEEHTSELQSPDHLVCRLLLEKKKE